MRPLEIALCVANAPLLVWCLWGRALPAWARVGPAVVFLLLVLQIALEGARWPLGPAYLVTFYLLFFACVWPRVPILGPSRWTAVCGIGLLAAAAVMGSVLPVFQLPEPTGAFPIGTVTLHLVDSARKETQGGRPGDHRELMIQIWYPADRSGPGQPYRSRAETSLVKEHLALARTHAAAGVPLAGARPRYPVVILTPSWTGRRSQNTVQAEELASHGFVVVGIDHPYATEWTVFPDGRTVPTKLGEFLDCSTDETFAAGERVAAEQLRIRTADVRFVLDELERIDRSDPDGRFTGRIDASRVGVFGHSFGGAVAAEACRDDSRVKAGANLDGLIFGEAMTKGIGKPYLVLADDTHMPTAAELDAATGAARRQLAFDAEDLRCIRRDLSEGGGFLGSIRGTRHMNFCDSPLYSPVKQLTHAGPIRPERAMEIINAYLVSFFQATLNDADEPLLDAPSSPYPEVEIERFSKGEALTRPISEKEPP